MRSKWAGAVAGGLCLALMAAGPLRAQAGRPDAPAQKTGSLSFRFLGPKVGNRVAAIAGAPPRSRSAPQLSTTLEPLSQPEESQRAAEMNAADADDDTDSD